MDQTFRTPIFPESAYFMDNALITSNFVAAYYQAPIFVSKGPIRLYLAPTAIPVGKDDPWPA